MITHMQSYFAKHYRWMFVILLCIIVVPFVFTYGPASNLTRNGVHGKAETFFGHNMSDEAHMQEQARMAAIDQWLKTGTPPQSPEELQVAVLERIVKMNMVERLGIPTPSAKQLEIYIAGLPPFLDTKGFFSKDNYKKFQERFAREEGLSKGYLSERIAECWRIEQFTSRLENASFYLPTTLQREYALLSSKYTVQIALLQAKPDSSITVSDDDVLAYFETHKEAYNSPETREGVAYRIPAEKFAAQVAEPTEEQLERYFGSIAMRFVKWQMTDEKGNVTGDTPKPPTLAENRAETLRLYKQTKAARAAAEAVDTIVQKIYAEKITPGSKAWDELIQASGVEVLKLGPVAQGDKSIDDNTAEMFFSRSLGERPYSEAFMTETDGRFVLLQKINPAAPQSFEDVKAKVMADARQEKQQKALAQTQIEKVEALRSAYAAAGQDADFQQVAKQEGFAISLPEAFELGKLPFELTGSEALFKGLLMAKNGDLVSDTSPVQATVILVKERTSPAFDAKNEQAQRLRLQIEKIYTRLGTFSFLNEWAQKHGRG